MNFTPVNQTGTQEGFCLIKTVEQKKTAKGVPFLDLVLADSSGEIGAKLWDYKEELHGVFTPHMLVKVRGSIAPFNDVDQMRVERIRQAEETDNVRMEDYVPSAPFDSAAMFAQLLETAQGFADEELRKLVVHLLETYRSQLLIWPAAFKLHHAVRGGLLYHTVSVLRLAQSVCAVYPFVDSDLLYTGVILHDICKIQELDVTRAGISTGYTTQGELVGHLVLGAVLVEKTALELGLSRETIVLVQHMLISHHGEPEFGAAMRPQFLEAELLAELDLMDARVYEIMQAQQEARPGSFSTRQWMLDNRRFYNHGRGEAGPAAVLGTPE